MNNSPHGEGVKCADYNDVDAKCEMKSVEPVFSEDIVHSQSLLA